MSTETLIFSGTVTASGTSSSVDLVATEAAFAYDVKLMAVAEGTTVDVTIEHSHNGSTWVEVDSVLGLADTRRQQTVVVDKPRRFQRVTYTLTGDSPSAKIRVRSAQAASYASTKKFASLGLPEAALSEIAALVLVDTLSAASGWANKKLQKYFVLPLVSWDDGLERLICICAAYDALVVKGYSSSSEDDAEIRKRFEDAVADLDAIAIHGDDTITGSPDNSTDDQEARGASFAVVSGTRKRFRLWPSLTSTRSSQDSTSCRAPALWSSLRRLSQKTLAHGFSAASRPA